MTQTAENFEKPILTVDIVLFALLDDRLHVLLPKRVVVPFIGQPALIGGYIHVDEDKDTHAAAQRVVQKKMKMKVPYLEQLATFSGAQRDPRGWSATVAYISMIKFDPLDENTKEDFYPVDKLPRRIAFDHVTIIRWAVERIRNKASYSNLPLLLMPRRFALSELQHVYEAMMGAKMDKGTFRYKILELDIVEETKEFSDPAVTNTRPAKLYRAKERNLHLFNDTMKVI